MSVTRREFFRYTGTGLAASALGLSPEEAQARELKIAGATKNLTICPYCSVGCGMLVYTAGGEVVYVEGDPDHPINHGTLCPKGASIHQLRGNAKRVTKPLYRAPGAAQWQEVEWDWAVDEIAKRVKKSRDESFETVNAQGQTVNRTQAIASVGSAALDNEEAYLYQKFLRGLGLVYIEHQARL
jgi:formate dehydrogenase major subunit